MSVCRDAGMDGRYTVHTDICHATAAIAAHQAEPGYQATPGGLLYATPDDTDDDTEDEGWGGPPPGFFD